MKKPDSLALSGSATLNHVFSFASPQLDALRTFLEQSMSELSDKIDAVAAAADAAIARVGGDIQHLKDEIAALEVKVAANPTPEDLAKLDALKSKLDLLDAPAAPPASNA